MQAGLPGSSESRRNTAGIQESPILNELLLLILRQCPQTAFRKYRNGKSIHQPLSGASFCKIIFEVDCERALTYNKNGLLW